MSDGFPSRASMNLAATPVPILAVYTPNAMSVRPAACCVWAWVQALNSPSRTLFPLSRLQGTYTVPSVLLLHDR